jgi:hypothetical protein
MSSITFSPLKMLQKLHKSYGETKRLAKANPVVVNEEMLAALEAKYHLDTAKLKEIGLL